MFEIRKTSTKEERIETGQGEEYPVDASKLPNLGEYFCIPNEVELSRMTEEEL